MDAVRTGPGGELHVLKRTHVRSRLWGYGRTVRYPADPRAHYEGTGPEIWRDCPEITHFVAGLGTSGTLLGVGRFLKEANPQVQVWAVEPPAGETVEGLRNLDAGYIPPIFLEEGGEGLLDRKTVVGPRDSIEWTRRLADLGVFAGISSGAALAGAIKCAESIEQGTVLFMCSDGGWKYVSTGAWTGEVDEVVERARARSTSDVSLAPGRVPCRGDRLTTR